MLRGRGDPIIALTQHDAVLSLLAGLFGQQPPPAAANASWVATPARAFEAEERARIQESEMKQQLLTSAALRFRMQGALQPPSPGPQDGGGWKVRHGQYVSFAWQAHGAAWIGCFTLAFWGRANPFAAGLPPAFLLLCYHQPLGVPNLASL